MEKSQDYQKGRGAQVNPDNRFLSQHYDTNPQDGIDEAWEPHPETQVIQEHAKTIINTVKSPDIPLDYSINPYQGCEHGCIYCYARNTHEYYGFSAGLDFEKKIIAKLNAADLLRKAFLKPKWQASPIMFSGNTDCYQPLERQFQLTRKCLEVFHEFHHPVGMITKNSLILRDIDLLQDLAKEDLVHVMISITTLDPQLKKVMEPRTAAGKKRIEVIKQLSDKGIPTGVMLAPMIPGLNVEEIDDILKASADAGAQAAHISLVRLNGSVQVIFEDWLRQHFPDRAEKVLHQIQEIHGGTLGDAQFGRRMSGTGPLAHSITQLFKLLRSKYFGERRMPVYDLSRFQGPGENQLSLF